MSAGLDPATCGLWHCPAPRLAAANPELTGSRPTLAAENDYQIDIATPEGRAEYKRIIDRAAQFGITSLLFAPQNSDVSSRANNSDAWG